MIDGSGGASDGSSSEGDDSTCAVERVEMAEERDGEIHYLLKWRGCGESDSTWVATSALAQHGTAVVDTGRAVVPPVVMTIR